MKYLSEMQDEMIRDCPYPQGGLLWILERIYIPVREDTNMVYVSLLDEALEQTGSTRFVAVANQAQPPGAADEISR